MARCRILLLCLFLTGCVSGNEPAGLVRVTEEPPGTNCPDGGHAIHTGLDRNSNGLLDPDELEDTSFICSSNEGGAVLVRTEAEPAGSNCADGGTVIHVGRDQNGNNMLDDTEIEQSSYVCAGAVANAPKIYGNLTIANQLDAARLVGLEEVTGSLTIDAPGLTSVSLDSLKKVGLDLRIANTDILSLSLPALEEVGQNLNIHNNPLTAVAAPQLTRVDGALTIHALSITSLTLPSLATVGAELSLSGGSVPSIELPALTETRSLVIRQVSSASLSAPMLTTVSKQGTFGTLEISLSPNLQTLALPLLSRVYGNVSIMRTALSSFAGMSGLTQITNQFHVQENMAMTSFGLPNLTQVVNLAVYNNPMLPTCAATQLASQTGATTVAISGNNDQGTCP